uniref:Leucine rich repeat containing 61 n=1 Tax=Malurus cyaneus samueli TaxID=2593467 RepID=A0A8C5TSH9_9PASS
SEPQDPQNGAEGPIDDAALLKATTGEFSLESILLLRLRGRGIAHLGCLADCSNLEWLDLSDNAIAGLAPLATLRALAVLNLAGNRVASVEPLRGCRSLRQLNLGLRHLESNPAVRAPTAPRWPPLLPGLKAIDGSAGWPRAALRLLRELDAALDATPRLPRPRSRRSRWVQAGFWEHGRRGRSAVLEEATAGSWPGPGADRELGRRVPSQGQRPQLAGVTPGSASR